MNALFLRIKHFLPNIYLVLSFAGIVLFSSLYVFLNGYFGDDASHKVLLLVFPLLNFVILVSSIFLFHGKHRGSLFFFSVSFSIFFNIKSVSIGSLFSYAVLVYCLAVFIEMIVTKKIRNQSHLKRLVLLSVFSFYSLLICFLFTGFTGFAKMFAQCGYFAFVFIYFCDDKKNISIKAAIVFIALGMLMANILACVVLYLIKGDLAVSFLKTFVSDVYVKGYTYSNLSFRYPGLFGDPNYLGFYTILVSILFVAKFKEYAHKLLSSLLIVSLHFFAILGMSKNYLLILIAVLAALLIRFVIKNKKGIYYLFGFIILSFFIFVALENILLPIIKRFVFLDTREGLLNALTTERSTLASYYLSEFLRTPRTFLLGNGIWGSMLDSGSSSHNIYISLLWYFGIFGSFLYILYFCSLLDFKRIKSDFYSILFLSVVCIYGLSLDFSTNAIIYFFCFSLFSIYVRQLEHSETRWMFKLKKEHRYDFYQINI